MFAFLLLDDKGSFPEQFFTRPTLRTDCKVRSDCLLLPRRLWSALRTATRTPRPLLKVPQFLRHSRHPQPLYLLRKMEPSPLFHRPSAFLIPWPPRPSLNLIVNQHQRCALFDVRLINPGSLLRYLHTTEHNKTF